MIDTFRHNSWATLRLLEFCRDIDPALLDATAPGIEGTVGEMLAHIVGWEEVLAGVVEGGSPAGPPGGFSTLDDLQERGRWLAERWERSITPELHPERLVEADIGGGRRLVRLGTVLAQVVHHGNHHRSQVCTVLSTVHLVPPALDGWAYGAWLAERGQRRRDDSF